MKATKSFAFFNRGFNSGASILHKHIQCIPTESIASNNCIPIEEYALKYVKQNKIIDEMFTIPLFKSIDHVFHKLDKDFLKNIGCKN